MKLLSDRRDYERDSFNYLLLERIHADWCYLVHQYPERYDRKNYAQGGGFVTFSSAYYQTGRSVL